MTIFFKGSSGGGSGGADVSAVTATAADVLRGKLFVNQEGKQVAGEIISRPATTITPSGIVQDIPAGVYLSGAQSIGKIKIESYWPFIPTAARETIEKEISDSVSKHPSLLILELAPSIAVGADDYPNERVIIGAVIKIKYADDNASATCSSLGFCLENDSGGTEARVRRDIFDLSFDVAQNKISITPKSSGSLTKSVWVAPEATYTMNII